MSQNGLYFKTALFCFQNECIVPEVRLFPCMTETMVFVICNHLKGQYQVMMII